MKKIYNYTFRAVCVYVIVLIVSIFLATVVSVETFDKNVLNANITKQLNNMLFSPQKEKDVCYLEKEQLGMLKPDLEEEEDVKIVDIITVPTPMATPIPTPTPTPTPVPTPEPTPTPIPQKPKYTYTQTADTTASPVLATASGNVSHYGHDCYGCTSGKTATGYDISDGRIYYTDSTYGSVRIVAAGKEYPFGTILRLSNSNTSPIIAIVLDRGGAIGSGKRYMLDLLTESNAAAYQAGVKYNMTIEVLRMGY